MKNITKIILVLLCILGILGTLFGCSPDSETDSTEGSGFPAHIQSICRVLTKRFVEDVIAEDYSMLAFNVEDYELDENEDGTIKILYLPSNAGEPGATKVNLTIRKNGTTYTVEYALLAGLYEVDLSQIPSKTLTFIDQ